MLLDKNFHPKLSDFGLAREGPEIGRTHVSTAVSVLFLLHSLITFRPIAAYSELYFAQHR